LQKPSLLLLELLLTEDALRPELCDLLELFNRNLGRRGWRTGLLRLELLQARLVHLVLLDRILTPLSRVVSDSTHHRCAEQRTPSSSEHS